MGQPSLPTPRIVPSPPPPPLPQSAQVGAIPSVGCQVRCAGCKVVLTVLSGLTEFVCPTCKLPQMLPPELMRSTQAKVQAQQLKNAPALGIDPTKIQLPCANCKAILNVPHGMSCFNCPQCHIGLMEDEDELVHQGENLTWGIATKQWFRFTKKLSKSYVVFSRDARRAPKVPGVPKALGAASRLVAPCAINNYAVMFLICKCMHGPNCKLGNYCSTGRRLQEVNLLGGLILPVWGTIEKALSKQARQSHKRIRVVRVVTTSDNQRIVGLLIPNAAVQTVLQDLAWVQDIDDE